MNGQICAKVEDPGISEKVAALLSAAHRIGNVSVNIETKLYGPKPCCETNGKEAMCLNDALDMVYGVLESAHNTLAGINDRL
jgi:hypothetical protein